MFSGALPTLVTSAFAAKFLLILAAANLGTPIVSTHPAQKEICV